MTLSMTRAPALLALMAPLLAACVVPIPIPLGTYEVSDDSCGAGGLQPYVGQPASAAENATIQRPDGTAAPIRIIRPGDVVTLDFNPERINFDVGADERVAAVRCG